MVEKSRLRTLGILLGVRETSLYRIDDSGGIMRVLNHSRTMVTERNGVQRDLERIEEVASDYGISTRTMREILNTQIL